MRPVLALFFIFIIFLATCAFTEQSPETPRSRQEFVKAINSLNEGITEDDVLSALGKPDDIRTKHDHGGISTCGTKEIWRYGTSGHLTTATLGQVYIGNDGKVQYIFGKGVAPSNLPPEAELRELLKVLGEVPSYNHNGGYNPRKVIRAVNHLIPLGEEKALSVIEEYLRVTSEFHDTGREGVFLVLRTMFEVPEDPGYLPPMHVGAPSPSAPKDPKLFPRFPITIEDDIPFILVGGYDLGGRAERPESHLALFRKNGRMRTKPLTPPHKPFQSIQESTKSSRWTFLKKIEIYEFEWNKMVFEAQVLGMMDTVYRGIPQKEIEFQSCEESMARFSIIVLEASKLDVRWDPKMNIYTFTDGTYLPEIQPRNYPRNSLCKKIPGLDVELIIERENPDLISITFNEQGYGNQSAAEATIKVIEIKSKQDIAYFETGGTWLGTPSGSTNNIITGEKGFQGKFGGYRSRSKRVKLTEGTEIQVEMTDGKETQLCPVFKP